jgi:hypothetical protein
MVPVLIDQIFFSVPRCISLSLTMLVGHGDVELHTPSQFTKEQFTDISTLRPLHSFFSSFCCMHGLQWGDVGSSDAGTRHGRFVVKNDILTNGQINLQ